MRVVTAASATIELGDLEATPTISIINYSRRVTDDFGVTTVVERGFARRMAVRLAMPLVNVDALQRNLADLRATTALWVASDLFASLSVRGIYKDFSIDLSVPPISFCTLTIEGVAEATIPADPGGDPAPEGLPSSLQMIQPVTITTGVLTASNVAENDAPEWVSGTAYAMGARVIKAATHRIYESLVIGNSGNDPDGLSGKWLDVGPTNRWAMFDQALGTATSASGSIVVTVNAGSITALALLDVTAATVRVQATGYDRTLAVVAGAIPFLDLPASAGAVTVTITGPGTVSVGTLVSGSLVNLGITEASPTAGITDYSRQTVDDFGEVTVTQRAWAKRMTANAVIRTDALDVVFNRLAAVRAQPSLWIGKSCIDSLTVYGFFKDFSIEVGDTVSKLSLSIEGLSTAAKIEPIGLTQDQLDDIATALATAQAASAAITSEAVARSGADGALATRIDNVVSTVGSNTSAISTETTARTNADGALGTRIDNVVATVGSNTTAISTEITSRTTADSALGNRIDNISATFSSNPNLCPDVSEWTCLNNAGFGISPYWGPAIQAAPTTLGEAEYARSPAIPVAGGAAYTLSCDLIGFQAINGAYAEADMYAVNRGGALTGYSGRSIPARTDFANGVPRYVVNWTPPAGSVAVYVRLLGYETSPGDIQVIGLRRPKLEFGAVATAYSLEGQSVRSAASIKDEATARASADGALATRATNLEATSGSNVARLNTVESVASDAYGRSRAFVRQIAVAGSGRAQLDFYADSNGGGGVDLVGDMSISGNLIVGGTITTPKIAVGAVTGQVNASNAGSQAVPSGGGGNTYLSMTRTTVGGPLIISGSFICTVGAGGACTWNLQRDGTIIAIGAVNQQGGISTSFSTVDQPGAGSHTYDLNVSSTYGGTISNRTMVGLEFQR
jgi:hypothetical protein